MRSRRLAFRLQQARKTTPRSLSRELRPSRALPGAQTAVISAKYHHGLLLGCGIRRVHLMNAGDEGHCSLMATHPARLRQAARTRLRNRMQRGGLQFHRLHRYASRRCSGARPSGNTTKPFQTRRCLASGPGKSCWPSWSKPTRRWHTQTELGCGAGIGLSGINARTLTMTTTSSFRSTPSRAPGDGSQFAVCRGHQWGFHLALHAHVAWGSRLCSSGDDRDEPGAQRALAIGQRHPVLLLMWLAWRWRTGSLSCPKYATSVVPWPLASACLTGAGNFGCWEPLSLAATQAAQASSSAPSCDLVWLAAS